MDVSIIIVNYNTASMTKTCIDSIFKYTHGVEFEVVLVDNASKDNSRFIFQSDDRINYIYLNQNIGFGRANNTGYDLCKGKYIFLLNSDTLLFENSVLMFYEFMEKYSYSNKIACCGCTLVDQNMKFIHSYGYFPSVKVVFADLQQYIKSLFGVRKKQFELINFNKQGFYDVDYITGADLFISRKSLENLDYLFDPDYFMYYEETDLQYRLRRVGYRRSLINHTSIIHLEGGSLNTAEMKNKSVFRFYKTMLPSMNLFLDKNLSWRNRNAYRLTFYLFNFPKILLKRMTFKERLNLLLSQI